MLRLFLIECFVCSMNFKNIMLVYKNTFHFISFFYVFSLLTLVIQYSFLK